VQNIALQYILIAKRYLIRDFLFVNVKLSLTAFKALHKKNPQTLHEIYNVRAISQMDARISFGADPDKPFRSSAHPETAPLTRFRRWAANSNPRNINHMSPV
jgi:hypothetical protein